MVLYHLAPQPAWAASAAAGTPYTPETYESDGFVHLTKDPSKLLPVGNAFYKSSPDDWLLIELEDACGDVRFEPAAPVGETQPSAAVAGEGDLFPHLYGPIEHRHVVRTHAVQRAADGTFVGVAGVTQ